MSTNEESAQDNKNKSLTLFTVLIVTFAYALCGGTVSFFSALSQIHSVTALSIDRPFVDGYYTFLYFGMLAIVPYVISLFVVLKFIQFFVKHSEMRMSFKQMQKLFGEGNELLLQYGSVAVIMVIVGFFIISKLSISYMKNYVCPKPVQTSCRELFQ
jgi:hypothetical protein